VLAATLAVRTLTAYSQPTEIAGGAVAALLWSTLLWRLNARARIAATLIIATVVLVALAPFHFSSSSRDFSWTPFRSFLAAPPEQAIRIFFEKVFLYGSMIWLMARAGVPIGVTALVGSSLVFMLRLLQVFLPGRSAEVTDAILVLMLAAMMYLTSRAAGRIPVMTSLPSSIRRT
jgi:hypothetical protein